MAKAPLVPDFRFENSYRRSIASANGSWLRIALITVRDQMLLPFVQGFAWMAILMGVRSWNLGASKNGSSFAYKLKAWWAQVNRPSSYRYK